jgi:hypothetical protein
MKQPLFYTLLATPISDSVVQPSPSTIASPPGQPVHKGDPGKFEIIGNSLVSAQQVRVDICLFSSPLRFCIDLPWLT